MADITYGVDFGTSNSAIAIMQDGRETVLRGRTKEDKTESSILFFPKWEMGVHYVGDEAITQYIESGMDGRLIQSIKSILPDTLFNFTWIHGKRYEIDDLVALIIQHLKKKADDSVNAEVTRAVFGRPAVFSDNPEEDRTAEQRLRAAALKAGFEEVHFQLEPIAAAFSYELRIDRPEIVLVADLGGGTSDFTIMRLDPQKVQRQDRTADILATGGIHIGGNDFDFEQLNIRIHEPITASEFAKFIHRQTAKFENYLSAFVANSGLDEKMIDTIFITGGSSLVPALREIFVKKFGEHKIRGGETFTSVASGLALSSVLFF